MLKRDRTIEDAKILNVIDELGKAEEKANAKKKKRKRLIKKILKAVAIVAFCVGIVVAILLCDGKFKWIEINPNDYLKVTCTGYDGFNGEYQLTWNTKGADKRVVDALENCVQIEIVTAVDEILNNGDKRFFNLIVDEEGLKKKKVSLTKYEISFTIQGLKEMTEVDVFQYVEAVAYDIPKGPPVDQNSTEWWWKNDTPEFILNSKMKVKSGLASKDIANSTAVVLLQIEVDDELYSNFYSQGYYLKEVTKFVDVELLEYSFTV